MGHYKQRGKRSFLLVLDLGRDGNGKRLRPTKTIRIEDEALLKTTRKLDQYLQKELAKFEIEVEAGEYIAPEKNRFEDFVKEWRERHAVHNYSPSILKNYDSCLRNHILPVFGQKRIGEIKTIEIIRFLDDKLKGEDERKDGRKGKLSTGTVRKFHETLASVFKRATVWKVIGENPMSGVSKPTAEKKEMSYYSSEDLGDVIDALNKESMMWRIYFLGALFGGLRRGELTALEWDHVSFEDNELEVENNIVDTEEGEAVVKGPKTLSSKASVVMPDWYMELLKDYETMWKREKLKAGEDWEGEPHRYLFHGGLGKALYYTTPTTKWRRFIKKHNLKRIRLHDLRHSMVALLMEEDDVNLPAIQRRARHSSTKITSDVYGHISKKREKQTADQFDKFNPTKKFANNSPTIR